MPKIAEEVGRKADGSGRTTSAESVLSTISNAEATIRPCLSRSSTSQSNTSASSSHGSHRNAASSKKLLRHVSFADLSKKELDALIKSREEDVMEVGDRDSLELSSYDLHIRIPSGRAARRRDDDPRVERLSRKLSQAFHWPTSGRSDSGNSRRSEKNAIARFFIGASKFFKKGRGRARGRRRSLSAEVATTVSLPMPF